METKNLASAIIMREDHCLVVRRKDGEYKDYWEFPGGEITAQASPEEVVVQAVKEELGCTVRIRHSFRNIEYDYPSFHLSKKLFICDITEGVIKLKEDEDYQWITIYQLDHIQWMPAEESIFMFLRNFLTAEMI